MISDITVLLNMHKSNSEDVFLHRDTSNTHSHMNYIHVYITQMQIQKLIVIPVSNNKNLNKK